MRGFGILLMGIGALGTFAAFMMDTTVSSGAYLVDRTHNLGLLQNQMMVLHSALALVLVGAIFTAVGSFAERHVEGGSHGDPAEPEVDSLLESNSGRMVIGGLVVVVMIIIFVISQ